MPKEITSVAPVEVARWFQKPGQFRLSCEAADAVAARVGPITPYWDVVLGRNSKMRQRFFNTLRSKGLLCYRRRVHSFVGLFCVAKKDGQIRLVRDFDYDDFASALS
jgi:hypothetical protein